MRLLWRIIEDEFTLLAMIEQFKPEPQPVRRQSRCHGKAVFGQAQATEAEHGRLPHRSGGCTVYAVLRVAAQVLEIYERGLHITVICHLDIPYAAGQDCLDARGQ